MTIKEKLQEIVNGKNNKNILLIDNEAIIACHNANYLLEVSSNRYWGDKEINTTIEREKDIVIKF